MQVANPRHLAATSKERRRDYPGHALTSYM